MRRLFTFLIILMITASWSQAQLSEKGEPISSYPKNDNLLSKNVPYITAEATNLDALKAEDAVRDLTKSAPWRFGENIEVSYNMENSGIWETLPNGTRVWRLGIYSPGALSINLTFDNYILPDGAKLFIYNPDKTEMIGAFTSRNNQTDRVFATTLVKGDAIILEYNEPAEASFNGEIQISRITHGYRNAFEYADKAFGSSGSCNMNVACPDAVGWEDEISSVCMLVSGSSGFCTGTLINNTAEDGTPYVLTADHCYSDPSSWIFWFNWESSTCTNPGSSPAYDDISGAVLRARNADSDFCLVEMNSTPPASYNVFYAGWNREDVAATETRGIHHPSGDIKKFSIDYDSPVSDTYLGGSGVADSHWQIVSWDELTTTEGGSSGSALFDQNHLIIGQLHGGYAACGNTDSDWYGKLSMSWDRGGTSDTQLKDWLDPSSSAPLTLQGYDPNAPTVALDAQMLQVSEPTGRYCDIQDVTPTVTIKNRGTDNLTSAVVSYSIDGGTPVTSNWSGNLASGETDVVTFATITLTQGNHTFETSVSSPNGSTDENTTNDVLSIDYEVVGDYNIVELSLTTDDYGSETSWQITDDATSEIVIAGSGYGNTTTYTESVCLGEGCYTFTIFDAYSDGICCGYGNGSYDLTNTTTSEAYVTGGGEFTNEEATQFCITASAPPVADFEGTPTTVCEGGSVVFSDLSTGTPTAWSWTFDGGTPATSTDQNPTVVYNTAGSYRVTLEVTNAQGTDTYFINNYITVTTPPTVSVTATDETSAGACDGSVTANVTNGTSPFSYVWDITGTATQTFSPGGTGTCGAGTTTTYDLNVTGLGNLDGVAYAVDGICLDITHARLSRITDISLISPLGTSVQLTGGIGGNADNYTNTCFNMTGADGAISGGTAPYTGTFIPMGDFATYHNGQAANGTWQLSITCSSEGGTLNSWELTFRTGETSQTVSSLCAGTYTVTVTDDAGCEATASGTVNSGSAALSASISASTNATCYGVCDGTATVLASGGSTPYTYLWSNGESLEDATSLCAGVHTVTVTDALSQTTTASVTITEPSELTISLSSSADVTCNGLCDGSIEVAAAGGTSGYSYDWDNGASTSLIENLCAGTYNITATDANACTAELSTTIGEPTALSVSELSATDASCFGTCDGSIEVGANGGTPAYSYNWDNGESTALIENLCAGTYAVTATDANNCTAELSITLGEPTEIATTFTTTDANCNQADGSATASSTGGSGTYTYIWSDSQTGATASNLAAGTYTVTTTDDSGCAVVNTVTINDNGGITVIPTVTDVLCNGDNTGAIDLSVSGGTSPYTYNWASGETSSSLSNLYAGQYIVTVSDQNNCSNSQVIDVLEPNAISIIPSITDALCNGETGSVTLSITGGTPPYNENWGSNNPDALLAGTYTVTVTDDAGCEETSPVTISEPTALAVDQANTVIFDVTCFGASDGTITVVATGGSSPYSYDWGTTDPNALAAGNYNVTITDANGCIITESFIVNEPSPLIANATITDPLCYGETGSVVLTITGGTPPYTEDWGTADPNALAAGFYTVTITDATGCYLVNTITVSDPPELTVSVSTTAATDGTTADGTATATATGGTMPVSYAWSNGENTQMISNLLPDVYCVTVTDANACTASVCDTVEFSISIAEQSGSELVIYPNPTDGLLNIKATSTINEIKIVNILGKTIETIHSGEKTTIIDLRSKAKGIYFIEITGNGFSNTERVILK